MGLTPRQRQILESRLTNLDLEGQTLHETVDHYLMKAKSRGKALLENMESNETTFHQVCMDLENALLYLSEKSEEIKMRNLAETSDVRVANAEIATCSVQSSVPELLGQESEQSWSGISQKESEIIKLKDELKNNLKLNTVNSKMKRMEDDMGNLVNAKDETYTRVKTLKSRVQEGEMRILDINRLEEEINKSEVDRSMMAQTIETLQNGQEEGKNILESIKILKVKIKKSESEKTQTSDTIKMKFQKIETLMVSLEEKIKEDKKETDEAVKKMIQKIQTDLTLVKEIEADVTKVKDNEADVTKVKEIEANITKVKEGLKQTEADKRETEMMDKQRLTELERRTKTTSNQRDTQIGKSRSQQRSDVQLPHRVIESVLLTIDVNPLSQSENPWKPTSKQLSSGQVTEKRTSLKGEVLFIMNRLTRTNFDRLASEMKQLNISTYEDLKELVDIFFDKVTKETIFVEAYALLCRQMSMMKVSPQPGMKEKQATFRFLMLTKCQQEFESGLVFEDPEEKRKYIEAEMPESSGDMEKTLYQMKLRRLKYCGNIRFIGELFKLNMLTENIMHGCIYRLLKARDDDSLVSLCSLITTVGQAMDTEKAMRRMDQYFEQMAKIAEECKSIIKFTLKDVIDLRNNNWIPRKEQVRPMRILRSINTSSKNRPLRSLFLQSQPLPPSQETPESGSRRGSRQRQGDNKPFDDGCNTVASKSLRINASQMKLSKNVVDQNSFQLGPGGDTKFAMWIKGRFGGTQSSQDEDRSVPPAIIFSALRGEEDGRAFRRSPSRGDSGVASKNQEQAKVWGDLVRKERGDLDQQ